jgi:hypothetical protein
MDVEHPNPNSGSNLSEERTEERRVTARRTEEDASREGPRSPEKSATAPTAELGTSGAALDDEWSHVVAEFVDDPRRAVTRAHELVGRALQGMIENLSAQCAAIEQQWRQAADSNADLNTETMRVCLQQYRAFAQRLSTSTESHEMPLPAHQGAASPIRH